MRPERFDENPVDEELLRVATSLCSVAAIWQFLGQSDRVERLVEQASDLLTERARRIAVEFRPDLVLQ